MTRLKSLLAAVALGATALTATVALSQPAARQRVAAPRAPLSAEDKALVDKAAAYLECAVDGHVLWGVGIHSSIVTASLKAVVSAVNRAQRG